MTKFDETEDPRRRLLIQALAAGVFSAGMPSAQAQSFFGGTPEKLPPGRSIYRLTGDVTVNDKPATIQTLIKPGDTVRTGKDSEVIFVVNDQSMIVRASSILAIEKPPSALASLVVSGFRLLTGKLLSVSRGRSYRVNTQIATIGIRGTGFYVESDPEQTYFCTCYGATDIAAVDDPESQETVVATHHDRPLYITKGGQKGNNIRNAPFINHTDMELSLIETLVGRTPPFVFQGSQYQSPRRRY